MKKVTESSHVGAGGNGHDAKSWLCLLIPFTSESSVLLYKLGIVMNNNIIINNNKNVLCRTLVKARSVDK